MRTAAVTRLLAISLFLAVAGCSSKPAANGGNSASSPNAPGANGAQGNAQAVPAPAPEPPPPPTPVVIPAGTTLTITLDQTVNSQTANNGDPFAASLAVP